MMTSRPGFTRFDRIVLLVVGGLLLAIGTTIALGDRVGVQVERYSPDGETSSTARISFTFSETMAEDALSEHLHIEPPLAGTYSVSGKTVRFTPEQPLRPGTAYHVRLSSGVSSTSGRQVLSDTTFSFRVRLPQVAYLAPADSAPANVWLASVDAPDEAVQLTASPTGVINFAVNPDGNVLAFAERSAEGTSDIKLLDLRNGSISQLTTCSDSYCDTPVWRPDGMMLAYHRVDLNTESGLGVSPTRVWLVDLTTVPYSNRPLFNDNQILGFNPQWSADGNRIAIYDNNSSSMHIRDFTADSTLIVPLGDSVSDAVMSPDGQQVAFSRLVIDEDSGDFRFDLHMAQVDSGAIRDVFPADMPVDDREIAWHPDGRHLALARRYTDERNTRTRQLFLVDIETATAEELIFDARYFNGFFSWDPQGDQLVIYRFPELTESGEPMPMPRPEIWTYNLAAERLTLIAQNAYMPDWLP